jgi:hypothetical protein
MTIPIPEGPGLPLDDPSIWTESKLNIT